VKDTYLVQRLKDAYRTEQDEKIERAFGGDRIQMGPDGWQALRSVFSFDYMGAAEYEFGTIPKCLNAMGMDHAKLVATQITVPANEIEPNWGRKRTAKTAKGKPRKRQPILPPVMDRTVYLLCRQEHVQGAEERIRLLAGNKIRTKMGTNFPQALDPIEVQGSTLALETKGWLELDNGFLFFVDKAMWRRATMLFTGTDPAPEV
jgi:hypothetical protein